MAKPKPKPKPANPTSVTLNFKTVVAQVAAADELADIAGRSRVDIIREALHIGLQELLFNTNQDLLALYKEAFKPTPPRKRRGKVYRLAA